MSKAIKVEDHIYERLDRLKVDRQTFSDVIGKLLDARLTMLQAFDLVEGSLNFQEKKREELDAMTTARAERADLESRRL